MKEADLYACLNGLDDSLLREALHPRRRAHRLPGVLAACLAAGIVLAGAIGFFPENKSEAPQSADHTLPEAASPRTDEANLNDEGKALPGEPDPSAAPQLIRTAETLGGVSPGMTPDEVRALLGEPDAVSNVTDTDANGVLHFCWWYHAGKSRLVLRWADPGAGAIVSAVESCGGDEYALSGGVCCGMSYQQITAAYPSDSRGSAEEYVVPLADAPELQLVFSLEHNAVTRIFLGELLPFAEKEDQSGMSADRMEGDDLTLWDASSGFAAGKEIRDARQIKYFITLLHIEERIPTAQPVTEAAFYVDFHNGTVISFSGKGDEGAIWHCEEDFTPGAALEAREAGVIFPEGSYECLLALAEGRLFR